MWALDSLRHPPILLHVHHGFGLGSDGARRHVERVALTHGLELRVQNVEVFAGNRGLEAAARTARYEALQAMVSEETPIALGHGWDDWIESLWLRLLSGSSPLFWQGLRCGMDPLFGRSLIKLRKFTVIVSPRHLPIR